MITTTPVLSNPSGKYLLTLPIIGMSSRSTDRPPTRDRMNLHASRIQIGAKSLNKKENCSRVLTPLATPAMRKHFHKEAPFILLSTRRKTK